LKSYCKKTHLSTPGFSSWLRRQRSKRNWRRVEFIHWRSPRKQHHIHAAAVDGSMVK